jgi:hypothetical protein
VIRAGVLWIAFVFQLSIDNCQFEMHLHSIQGSQPLSRYGDCQNNNLTLGITHVGLLPTLGLHRFEPVAGDDRSSPGQCYLPDKELRYLRTVIVTAAVYRSFGCELHQ